MNYQIIYERLIRKSLLKKRIQKTYYQRKKENFKSIYYEKHHIIPKCMGGTNDEKNLVLLTAREHYVAHKLLTYIHKGNRKIAYAFHVLTYSKNGNHIKSSRDYKYAIELIKTTPVSLETKKKMRGKIPWNKGKTNVYNKELLKHWSEGKKGNKYGLGNKSNTAKKFSEEHKKKISDAHKGKKHSEESKLKMSKNHADVSGKNNGMFGKNHTEDSRKKMSIAVKNRKKIKCCYCNKEFDTLNYNRWHGELCKNNQT